MHIVPVGTGASQALRHGSHDITEVIHAEFRNLAFDSDSNGGLRRIRKVGRLTHERQTTNRHTWTVVSPT